VKDDLYIGKKGRKRSNLAAAWSRKDFFSLLMEKKLIERKKNMPCS